MDRLDGAATIAVTVAYSPRAREVDAVEVALPGGATLLDALRASGVLARHPEIDLAAPAVGIWGRHAALDQPLRPHDRVEIYRPLAVDPKEARRLRYRQHRAARKR